MNNLNTRVHLNLNSKILPNSEDWLVNLQKLVRKELHKMQREFFEVDFASAVKSIDHHQFSLAGVTFLLYYV